LKLQKPEFGHEPSLSTPSTKLTFAQWAARRRAQSITHSLEFDFQMQSAGQDGVKNDVKKPPIEMTKTAVI
jgi:hypothetical protein